MHPRGPPPKMNLPGCLWSITSICVQRIAIGGWQTVPRSSRSRECSPISWHPHRHAAGEGVGVLDLIGAPRLAASSPSSTPSRPASKTRVHRPATPHLLADGEALRHGKAVDAALDVEDGIDPTHGLDDERRTGKLGQLEEFFFYSRGRMAEHPNRHLIGYVGILQADAYAGFNVLPFANTGTVVPSALGRHHMGSD